MQMICPVGLRATAVIMPIKTLYEKDPIVFNSGCRFTLLHWPSPGDKVKLYRDKCEEWIRQNIKGATIDEPCLFPSNSGEVTKMLQGDDLLYLNVNGGMHWQVSYLALHLPAETVCVANDDRQLYRWALMEDVGRAESFELTDLGLETYLFLDDQIGIEKKENLRKCLSKAVQQKLRKNGQKCHWSIALKNESQSNWGNFLNEHIILIEERRGRLIFMLDLCNGHGSIQLDPMEDVQGKQKEKQAKLNERYRILNALINEIRYGSVIVTDNSFIKDRAAADGIEVIAPKDIVTWRRNPLVTPKSIMPNKKPSMSEGGASHNPFAVLKKLNLEQKKTSSSKTSQTIYEPLHVCLGDNSVPTLRLAMNGRYSPITLWYDNNSLQIKYLADLFKKIINEKYPDIELNLKETDHRGKGIIDADIGGTGQINITPGTKMQGIALTAAARKSKAEDRLTSIDGIKVKYVATGKDVQDMSLENLPPETLLQVQVPPFADSKKSTSEPQIWLWIMENLAQCKLRVTGPDLFQLLYGGNPAFKEGENTIIRLCDKKSFAVPPEALGKGEGFWWEYVVAHVLKENLGVEIFSQVRWNWPNGSDNSGALMSELDVVFTKDGETWAVSCKTSKETRNVLPLKSEAERRLGRMVHSCLAVPHNDMENSGKALNGVLILTPKIFQSREGLLKAMDDFQKDKRTGQVRKQRGDTL